jgi:nucleoside-diphosphate-sugar epimerase
VHDGLVARPTLQGRVLLTGASGFIGGRLRRLLLEDGADVVALRRPGSPPAKGGRSVEADYKKVRDLQRIVATERPDFVLHAAGVTKGSSYHDFRQGNVMPTRNLLSALRREHPRVKRFVLVSSMASYGPSASSAPQRESNPPRPIEYYGQSKLEAERLVEEESGGLPWTIVRPCAVYGPGDVDHFALFQSAMLGANLFYGNSDRWVSWIYVDDCIRGIVEAAVHAETLGKGYFLTHDPPLTWADFQSEVVRAVGKPVRTIDLPAQALWAAAFAGEIASRIDKKPRLFNLQKARLAVQPAATCSGDAARRDFGFTAEIDLPEGVLRTHQWYLENDWYQSLNPRELLSPRSFRRLVRNFRRGHR